jgi:hypothetical protein
MSDEFERHAAEFLAFARRIFDAGAKAERERLFALLQVPGERPPTVARVSRKPRRRSRKYGSVSAPIRKALNELSVDSPRGVKVADLVAHFELHGAGPTEKQIRAALKNLSAPGGEVVRIDRGKYLSRGANESRSAEKPGGDAPGSFNFAAE